MLLTLDSVHSVCQQTLDDVPQSSHTRHKDSKIQINGGRWNKNDFFWTSPANHIYLKYKINVTQSVMQSQTCKLCVPWEGGFSSGCWKLRRLLLILMISITWSQHCVQMICSDSEKLRYNGPSNKQLLIETVWTQLNTYGVSQDFVKSFYHIIHTFLSTNKLLFRLLRWCLMIYVNHWCQNEVSLGEARQDS